MKAVVWSKNSCPYCEQAKNMLQLKGIEIEERNITQGTWTTQQLLEAVPNARAVPQIFLDDEYIGGFKQLTEFFKNA